MNHKKLDKTLNVKEKCLQQTRLPKVLGWLYACKVRFTCSHVLDDVSLQFGLPPPHLTYVKYNPYKTSQATRVDRHGRRSFAPAPSSSQTDGVRCGQFCSHNRFTLRDLLRHTPHIGHQSAHKHYSGKISYPKLSHTPGNRGQHPTVFLFSHKFTNSQSAHKHYSGKISYPTLPHTQENRGMLPPVFLFSHKFTNS